MVACGAILQPTTILREIKRFRTSTCPAQVETDVGRGYIKAVNNPEGAFALAYEVIAAEMAVWMELAVPPFAIVDRCDIDVPMTRQDGTPAGLMEG